MEETKIAGALSEPMGVVDERENVKEIILEKK